MDFIEACRKVISLDSTPTHGSKDLVEWLASYCAEKGLHVEMHEEFYNDLAEKNIIIRPNGGHRPIEEFLLQTHLDTADPGPFSAWIKTQCNPFDATIIDGNIYGLGAADTKLDILCKIEALSSYEKEKPWKLPPVIVGTFGEESGMMGALKLIRKNLISTKMALVGEPSGLRTITAAKGIANVEIRIPFMPGEMNYRDEHNLKESMSTQSKLFHGKSAHSSMPQRGESAIIKMLDYLSQLPQSVALMAIDGGTNFNTVPSHAFLEIDLISLPEPTITSKIVHIYKAIQELMKEFSNYQDIEFTPNLPTLNIGLIRTYSDHILISGNCRIPPSVSQPIYDSWVRKLDAVCKENSSFLRVSDYKKPFRTEKNTILVKSSLDTLRKMGLDDKMITQASTNEASLFSRIGIDCVCFGPGCRDNYIDATEEHVSLSDLEKATAFYTKMIERLCS